jgi:hypothetical protein
MAGMRRARSCALVVALVLAGCGGGGGGSTGAASTAPAKAACTRPVLLRAVRTLSTADPVVVERVRCATGYALTRVQEGEARSQILWQDVGGTWTVVARDDPAACPQLAAQQKLCTLPPPDPALRRCTTKAFLEAVRDDVEKVRSRVDELRCRGDFARTRFTILECLPGQTGSRRGCERTRIAAWRRDATRWRLITYADKLDCDVVRAAAPKYPPALCS